jgi:hypothetical protein
VTAAWTPEELAALGAAEKLEVAPARPDGSLRPPTRIWVVRVGGRLYVRSWRGRSGRWLDAALATHAGRVSGGGLEHDVEFVEVESAVDDAVDDAFRAKYRGSSYLEAMLRPEARATTLELVPGARPARA